MQRARKRRTEKWPLKGPFYHPYNYVMRNIVKKDLVADVAARTGIPAGRVKDVVEAFMGQITAYLSHNRTIELRGFGTFSCRLRKGRPALNPRTKGIVRIPDRLVPVLRFSPSVKDLVTVKEVV